jgi:SAM-dependent methyltransferase
MVELYNATATQLGLSAAQMRGVRADLLDESGPGDTCLALAGDEPGEFANFHMAVMSMALHHVADPAKMVAKLAERLAPGGSLVIIDWLAHGSTPEGGVVHPAAHTITRHGFAEEEVRGMFAEAGLGEFGFLLHPETSRVPGGGEQQLFFARGKVRA